eukprot:scaffold28325_cov205-Amphora_coffeaeformis.AAC.2
MPMYTDSTSLESFLQLELCENICCSFKSALYGSFKRSHLNHRERKKILRNKDRRSNISLIIHLLPYLRYMKFPTKTLASLFMAMTRQQQSNRRINMTATQVVPATPSGPLFRLVGTVDIDGQGTHHALAAVDPFMLLDYATIPKPHLPPFGAHPHRGHSVVTILLQGKVSSWDSVSQQRTVIAAPASYWVDAGSGLFHDELSVMEDENDASQHVKLFQLWMSVPQQDRLLPPRVQYDTDLTTVNAYNADHDVVGTIRYHVGGGKIQPPHPVQVAYVTQQPGTTMLFPLLGMGEKDVPNRVGGFVINVQGHITINDGTQSTKAYDVIVLKEEENTENDADDDDAAAGASPFEIHVDADSSSPDHGTSEYLVCWGEQIQQAWYKKLAASGAIIAQTPQEAREIAVQMEAASARGKATGDFSPFGVPVINADL